MQTVGKDEGKEGSRGPGQEDLASHREEPGVCSQCNRKPLKGFHRRREATRRSFCYHCREFGWNQGEGEYRQTCRLRQCSGERDFIQEREKYAEICRTQNCDERGLKAGTKVFGLSGWEDGSPFMDRGRNWLRV